MPSWDVHFDVRIRVDEPRLVRAVERSRAIAETIRGIPVTTNVRKRLNALNIARAVRGTAAIEGTRISEEEALEVLDAPADVKVLPPDRSRDEHEARNAQAVLRFVRRELRANPERRLDEPLIREIHRLTTEGVPYKGNEPGHYRNHAVSAGDYRPPASGDEVRRLMSDFVRWFDEGTAAAWDPIVRAAIAHFYVVSIHPFGDGNGRASRGVESFMLYRAGINAFGFYSLANFYYQNRDAYVDALTAARFRSGGDLTDFVLFAVEGLATELEGVRRELMSMIQVIAFWEYARQTLGAVDGLGEIRRTRMLNLIRRLTSAPLASGPHENVDASAIMARVYRRVGQRTGQRDIRVLLDHELVVERDGQIVPNVEIMSRFAEG